MKSVPFSSIKIPDNRQRKVYDPEKLMELVNSIDKSGLLHPPVVRQNGSGYLLVAGEHRLKAIETLWMLGKDLRYGTHTFESNLLPVNFLGDLDPIDAFECELEENIRRLDLEWQERVEATSQLFELRRLQANKAGGQMPTTAALGHELYPDHHPKAASKAISDDLILARNLRDPDVAKAASRRDGLKVVRRKEEAQRAADLGERVGRTFSAAEHQLIKADCLEWLAAQPANLYDVILTDPPYGIDAQDFNDSGGKADATGHTYDDSLVNWRALMHVLSTETFRLAKPQAHCYVFCDVDNFLELRGLFAAAGWETFRTPLVWHNPSSQRAPWPTCGPHRRYQLCLYAIKGKRPVYKLAPDLVEYKSDENLGHAAQKPVALYQDFLTRSCRAGDTVLDPFCGSGTIFPAAHNLKIKATGVEQDSVSYGIAVKRLESLK